MKNKLPVEAPRKSSNNSEYETLRTEMLARFDLMIDEVGRSHQSLYAFLGHAYCFASKIDNSPPLRVALVIDAEQVVNDARPGKRRWLAHKHDSYDLLLTLRTKLAPDLAASKSGWLQSLRAAAQLKDEDGNPAPVEATESAFIKWITPMGVSGARKLAKTVSDFNLCEFAEGIEPCGTTFTIDLPSDAVPPEGVVEVLARIRGREQTKAEVEVIGVIYDERRIRGASAWYGKHIDRENRAFARKFEKAEKKYKKTEYGDPGAPDIEPDVVLTADEIVRLSEEASA